MFLREAAANLNEAASFAFKLSLFADGGAAPAAFADLSMEWELPDAKCVAEFSS